MDSGVETGQRWKGSGSFNLFLFQTLLCAQYTFVTQFQQTLYQNLRVSICPKFEKIVLNSILKLISSFCAKAVKC